MQKLKMTLSIELVNTEWCMMNVSKQLFYTINIFLKDNIKPFAQRNWQMVWRLIYVEKQIYCCKSHGAEKGNDFKIDWKLYGGICIKYKITIFF